MYQQIEKIELLIEIRMNAYYFRFELCLTFNLFTFLKRTNCVLNIFSDYFCGQILAQIQDHKKVKI